MAGNQPVLTLGWDFKQQEAFSSFFHRLPDKPTSTIRFFAHSDSYTLHGDDARFASKCLSTIIKYVGDEKLPYVFLKKAQFETFVRDLLLVRQYRVEVYVKTQANRFGDWEIRYLGSPGNLGQFEEILFEDAVIEFSQYIIGVKIIKNQKIAVACVNPTELKFEVCEFEDNDSYTELEALIAQVGPRECIIPQGDTSELVALKKVLDRNSVLVAKAKRSDFSAQNIAQDLNRLLYFQQDQQRNYAVFTDTQLVEALGCLNAVIKFLNLANEEQNFNQFKLSQVDIHRYVRLDNAALFSLHILPKPRDVTMQNAKFKQQFCLKGVLDRCATSQGRRLLEKWIKQPLKDIGLIEARLDIVECLVRDSYIREKIHEDVLTRLPDLLLLAKKLSSKKGNLQNCYRVYQIIGAVPMLINELKKLENVHVTSVLVHQLEEMAQELEPYKKMIEEVLDLELVERGEYLLKCTFNEELAEIHQRKQKLEAAIQKLLRVVASDLGFEEKTIKLEFNDQHGYFFRVTLKEESALRSNSRYKILDAVKSGVRFTYSKLEDLSAEYLEVRLEYEEQQKRELVEVFGIAAGYAESLRNLNHFIAMVDVFVSFAHVAVSAKIPYVRPKLQSGGCLELVKLRHPCLEQQEHVTFIPNSVKMSHEEKSFYIITGPNMGGKSTFIQSVGVCVLMAQIGCFVPCSYAEIPIVDAILSRVGAQDCQYKGLSTFMLEMVETSTILNTATRNSLVIIDELGRGTSTYDGCGIAFSIAEYLAKEVKCFALFATHFHEIARLGDTCLNVGNKYVSAVVTDDTITPLYQVKDGECDESYGIHCARMCGFPSDVTEAAEMHLKNLENTTGMKLIRDLEPGVKRSVVSQADDIMREYVRKIAGLEALNDEEWLSEVDKIKEDILKEENLLIQGLIKD